MPRAKKTETTPAKETTAKKCVRTKVELFIEHNGVQTTTDEIVKNVKATYAAQGGTADIKKLKIYIKPEDNSAYFVVNEDESGKMDVYFWYNSI